MHNREYSKKQIKNRLGLSLSERCRWRFKPSGMWRWILRWVVAAVSKDHSASTFRVKQSKKWLILKSKTLRTSEMSGTTRSTWQLHISEDTIPQICSSGILKFKTGNRKLNNWLKCEYFSCTWLKFAFLLHILTYPSNLRFWSKTVHEILRTFVE